MRYLSGLGRNADPILRDIERAARAGFFEGRKHRKPSELATTPILDLLNRVRMMSRERRWTYLAEIGDLPKEEITLSSRRNKERRYDGKVRLSEVATKHDL